MTSRVPNTLKSNMPVGVTGGTTVQDMHDVIDTFSTRTSVSVREFGAAGNGSADDTTAIQSAINALGSGGARGGIVFLPSGVYRISSPLVISTNGIELRGEGVFNTTLSATAGNFDAVRIVNCQHSGVTNIHFWPPDAVTPNAGVALLIQGSFECWADNIFIYRHYNGVLVLSSTETRLNKVRLLNLYGTQGIELRGTSAAQSFRLVCTDCNGANDSVVNNNMTWFLQNSYGHSLSLLHSVGVGGGYGIVMRDDLNTGVSRPSFLFCQDSGGDQNEVNALALIGGDTVNMIGCYLSSAHAADNVFIGPGHAGDITLNGCRIFGGYHNGVAVSAGPRAVNITSCLIGNNNTANITDAHGIRVADNATHFAITGNTLGQMSATNGNAQRYGVRVSGTSNHFIIANNQCAGNLIGAVFDGSSGSAKLITGNVI